MQRLATTVINKNVLPWAVHDMGLNGTKVMLAIMLVLRARVRPDLIGMTNVAGTEVRPSQQGCHNYKVLLQVMPWVLWLGFC